MPNKYLSAADEFESRLNQKKSAADEFETRLKQRNAQGVYEQITRDMTDMSSLVSDLYDETYNRYKNGNDTYRADSRDWLERTTNTSDVYRKKANEVDSLLAEYEGVFSTEWSAKVRKAMDSDSEGIKKITENAAQENGFWSQFKDADAYSEYKTYTEADVGALTEELTNLEDLYKKVSYRSSKDKSPVYWGRWLRDNGYSGDKAGLNALKSDIEKKKAFVNTASRYQTGDEAETARVAQLVEQAKSSPDFDKLSAEGAAIENPSYNDAFDVGLFSKRLPVENPVTFSRENYEGAMLAQMNGVSVPKAFNKSYHYLTDDETATYNYYLAAENAGLVAPGTAQNFLDEAQDLLNEREGEQFVEKLPDNVLSDLLVGVYAGGEQFVSGIEGIGRFVDDWRKGEDFSEAPVSAGEYALSAWKQTQEKREDGTFWGWVASNGGQLVTNLSSTITNQIPSIMTSAILSGIASPAVGETTGAALMGAGAAGNAYNEFVRAGYTTEQARLYGTLIGLSETLLEKAIGGISAFGGGGAKISSRIIEKICKGVSNANAKIAIKFGGQFAAEMLSEGIEEFTQDVLEPYFQALVTGGKPEAVDWEQAAYSGLLGALSAGLMNGAPGAIKTVQTVSNARNINGTTLKNLVIENFSEDSLARQYAMELGDNPTTWQKAKLLYEVESGFEGDMVSDLENELIKQGVDRATAHKQAQDIGTALTSGRDITLPDEETANAVDALSTSILARLSARNSIGELTFAGSIDAKTIAPRILELTKPTDTAFDIANTIRKQGATVSDEFANDIKQNLVNIGVMEADAETMVNEFRKASVTDTDVNKDALSVPDLLDRAVMDALVRNITESEKIKADIDKVNNETKEVAATTESPSLTNEESVESVEDTKDEAGLRNLLKKLNINADESSFRYDTLSGDEAKAYLRGLETAYILAYYNVDPTKSNFSFKERLTESEIKTMDEFGKKAGAKDAEASDQGVPKRKGSVRGYNVTVKELQAGFNKNQKSVMKIITAVARAKGINVILYDSSKGNIPPGLKNDNGAYSASRRTIYLDISAGVRAKDVGNLANYTLLQTFSHEFVHALETDSPTAYREFRQFIFDKMTERGQNVHYLVLSKQAQYGDISYDEASREVVAESMVNIFSEEKVVKDLYDNHFKIFKKILKAFQDFVDELKAYFERTFTHGNTVEAQAVMDGIHYVEGVADAFIKLMNAKPQLQEELTKNTPAETTEATTEAITGTQDGIPQSNAFTEALKGDMQFQRFAEKNPQPKFSMGLDGTIQTIVTTLPDGTKATNINGGINSVAAFTNRQVREAVMKANGYSKTQIKRVNDFMDAMDKFLEKMGIQYKFVGLDDVEKARLSYRYDENGNVIGVVLSAMVKNGDYPVNFDLTSICKKRTAVSQLIGKLASAIDENNKSVNLTPKNLFKINEALKEAGYETACLGCFVESKRYNVMNWARKICDRWNNAVREVNPDATYFDYSNGNEDEITPDRIDAFEKARQKYANMPKSKSMEEALAKFQKKADEGKPLIKAYKVATEDGVIENTFSKTARGKIENSDILTEEQKDYFLSMDVNDLEVSDVEVLMNAGIVSGGGLSSEQVIKNLVNSGEIYQHLLRPSDLLTAKGMAQLNKLPNFYGTMYRQYGSATPKPIQGFTPYNSEIALLPDTKGNMSLADYLYNIAGVRMQSFSDFQIQNIYDYLQMVGDLAARKLTAHAYTKEISFARLLGMTGVKTNLSVMFDIDPSLIETFKEKYKDDPDNEKLALKIARDHAGLTLYDPNVYNDKNYGEGKGDIYGKIVLHDQYGDWVYNIGDYATQKAYKNAYPERARRFVQSIGFAEAVALQTSPGYTKNCGIIGVGMSRLGIMAMLDDNRIRYIIPYHSSSLPKVIKTATNIEYATDFTPWQNTVKIKSITDNEGNEVSWSVKEAVARLGSADAAIRELNEKIQSGEWKVKTGKATTGHGSFALYEDLAKTSDPRKTASNYIEWCASNNTLPVFYEYANHNNFYKLLYDFNVYDTVTEEYAPLEAVQNIYPTMKGDQVVPQNLVDGDFDTSYMEKTIEDQMKFMDDFNRRQDLATTNLAENIANRNRYEITLPKDLKKQFAGEKALTADKDALAKAKQMEEDGKTSEEIRQETGWFKSYDGKWRFEIDDSKAKMVDIAETFGKKTEPMFEDEEPGLEIKYPIHTTLGKVLVHPDLYKAYPKLKKVPVILKAQDNYSMLKTAGSTDGETISLYIDADRAPLGTLLHEVQHIIQGIEGFAQGTNPGAEAAEIDRLQGGDDSRELGKKINTIRTKTIDMVRAYNRKKFGDDGYHDDVSELAHSIYEYANESTLARWEGEDESRSLLLERIKEIGNFDKGVIDAIDQAHDEITALSKKLAEQVEREQKAESPYVRYERTAGEIEARDVSKRQPLTPEKRKATRPDIDRDDAIVKLQHQRKTTTEEDAEYEEAYFDGDDERMQELVDKAAYDAGYKYKAYHHTENAFTVFDINKARRTMDVQGFYFSADPEAESEYGSVRYDTYLKMDNPYIVDSKAKLDAIPVKFGVDDYGVKVREWLQDHGYDSVIRKADYYGAEADEYIVFKPNQIKSAEPVVYADDENGEGDFIPLSERFNPRKKDMRFQRRNDWRLGDWEILSRAAENLEGNNYTDEQKKALTFFQSRLNALQLLQKRSEDLWEQYRDQLKAKDRKAADKTLAQRRTINLKIEQAADEVTKATEPKVVRDLLKEARAVVETQEREHGAEVLRRYRDRRDNSEAIAKYKKRVLKDSHELQKWITNPDDKAAKRVPDVIKNSVIDFLSLINETSTSALKGKAATQADYKFAERLRNLRDAIKTQVKDLDGLYSGYTDLPEDFFDEMEYFINMVGSLTNHTDEFVINAMTSDELKRLSATITAIKHYVQLMNAFQANAIYQHVFDAGDDTISYLEQMKKAGFTERGIFNYFTWTQMRPAYAWARFGKGGEAIFDELRRAQDTLAFNAAEIIEFTKKLYTDKEVNEWTKETKTFDINGDKVEVPVSFIMSLYELMQQEDSRRHIETNGLRFAAYSKGARKIADEGHVAPYDKVMEIVDSLTDRQKEVADGLQRFMATRGAEWGNYVSMKRFGREAFSNLRYFPINSDGRYLESSGEEKPNNASLYALLNMSFTKARNPHANNRLVVYDIFDVFANHMASMAQYNAFALPILDALKWLNYSTTDMQGNPLSIKDEMARVYGTPTEGRPGKGSAGYAERFVTNILKAFNGTETQANPTDNVGLGLLRRYNQAQIAYNFRVVVQQPMAIVRAASILPGVTLAKGALKNLKTLKANIEEMQKYSGIAKLKSLGYYDTNVSPGLTKQIKHDENFLDKAGDIGMKPAEFADDVTWAAIWVASKEQAKGDLEKAVEIFEDVIYKTQVVDSVLTKTEFMRNKGGIARILSSFMSEPVTTASMMVNAIEQFNRDRKSGMSQQELWKRHGKNFARVTAVYAVNAIVLAVAEAAMDALRDDSDDPYIEKYGEKFWENFLDEISPFAKYPIIKDIEEMVKGFLKIFGLDTYGYQPRTITGQGIEQFLKGTQIIVDKIDGQKKGYTWYAGIYKLLQGLSGLTGTHFGTITREVITTWNTLVGGMNPSLKVRSYVSNDDLSGMIVRAAQKGDSEALESLRDKYYTDEDAFKSAYKSAIGDAYIAGEISAEEASKLLERYQGADEAHWQIDRWNYKAENGTSDGYKKYDNFFTAVETGQNLKAVIKEYTDNGVDKKTLASQITSHFKPIYTQASKAEKARLKGYLLNAYEVLGYNRKQKSKDIDAWG